MNYINIHNELIVKIKNYKKSHSEVLDSLFKVEKEKVYLKMGYGSLWNYLIKAHHLGETDAGRFLHVFRASQKVPEFKEAVKQGEIEFSKAACIASTVTKENKDIWIEKAKTSSVRKLQEEVVKVNPKARPRERITPRSENLFDLKGGVSNKTLEAFKRVQDLLSQKKKCNISFDETIFEMSQLFLDKNDPVKKAQRIEVKKTFLKSQPPMSVVHKETKSIPVGRAVLPAWIWNEVFLKSNGRCMAKLPDGSHCDTSRYLEVHHQIALSHGGTNHPSNLNLLCSGHHKGRHLDYKPWISVRRDLNTLKTRNPSTTLA